MKCTKCGAQLEPGMQTCPLCGAPGEGAESLEQTAVETLWKRLPPERLRRSRRRNPPRRL